MAPPMRIEKVEGVCVARAADAVVAESRNALALYEGSHPPVIYFPRDDVSMEFFEPSETRTLCPHKGEATHYTLIGESERLADAAWSYENPLEAVAQIAGHIAFYPDKVVIERF